MESSQRAGQVRAGLVEGFGTGLVRNTTVIYDHEYDTFDADADSDSPVSTWDHTHTVLIG